MKRIKSVGSVKPAPTLKLDLGCGANKKEGFVGVDLRKLEGVDVQQDLFQSPWPWGDGDVAEIHCSHFVEHTPDLIAFMNECHRILMPGGIMTVIAPYYTSMRAWQDPTHTRAISEATFLYFNRGWRETNKLDHYPITTDFDFGYGYNLDGHWLTRSEEARNYAIRHYWNVVNDIHVTLTKRPRPTEE